MVVERADSLLRTLTRTKDPRRIFTGRKTWSPLEPGSSVEIQMLKVPLQTAGYAQVIRRDRVWDDTIHVYDVAVFSAGDSEARDRVVIGEDINKPEESWSGKIRYTKPQGSDR